MLFPKMFRPSKHRVFTGMSSMLWTLTQWRGLCDHTELLCFMFASNADELAKHSRINFFHFFFYRSCPRCCIWRCLDPLSNIFYRDALDVISYKDLNTVDGFVWPYWIILFNVCPQTQKLNYLPTVVLLWLCFYRWCPQCCFPRCLDLPSDMFSLGCPRCCFIRCWCLGPLIYLCGP